MPTELRTPVANTSRSLPSRLMRTMPPMPAFLYGSIFSGAYTLNGCPSVM